VEALADPLHLAGSNLRSGQLTLEILHGAVEGGFDRFVTLDLENQVNATLEVQSKAESLAGEDRGPPRRNGRDDRQKVDAARQQQDDDQ
jgi:hypothetical protein